MKDGGRHRAALSRAAIGALVVGLVAVLATVPLLLDWHLAAPLLAAVLAGAITGSLFWIYRGSAAKAARENLSARQAAASDERARLAREMHDSLSKTLDAIALGAAALPSTLDEPDRARRLAQTLRDGTLDAARDARALIGELRSHPADVPLAELVWAICQDWSTGSGIAFTLHREAVAVEPHIGIELCWILREALRNVASHSGASAVVITLAADDTSVVLTVDDDGRGLPPADELARLQTVRRYGLVGMQERARTCGGRLAVGSSPDGGARVRAVLPLAEPASAIGPPRWLRVTSVVGAAVLCGALVVIVGRGRAADRDSDLAVPTALASEVASPQVTSVPTDVESTKNTAEPTSPATASPTPRSSGSASRSPSPRASASPSVLAAGDCEVNYLMLNEWDGGFIAEVVISNTGSKDINGWTLLFDFPAGQKLISSWDALVGQNGATIIASDGGRKPHIPAGGSIVFGIQGTWSGVNTSPSEFTLNSGRCG